MTDDNIATRQTYQSKRVGASQIEASKARYVLAATYRASPAFRLTLVARLKRLLRKRLAKGNFLAEAPQNYEVDVLPLFHSSRNLRHVANDGCMSLYRNAVSALMGAVSHRECSTTEHESREKLAHTASNLG